MPRGVKKRASPSPSTSAAVAAQKRQAKGPSEVITSFHNSPVHNNGVRAIEPVANGHGGKGDEDGGHPEDEHGHEDDSVLLLLLHVDRLRGLLKVDVCGNVSRVYSCDGRRGKRRGRGG